MALLDYFLQVLTFEMFVSRQGDSIVLSNVLHYEHLNLAKLERIVQGFKLSRPCVQSLQRSNRGWWFWGDNSLKGTEKNCQEQLLEDIKTFK